MRKILANWVAENYARRAPIARRAVSIIATVGLCVMFFCAGIILTASFLDYTLPLPPYTFWFIGFISSVYCSSMGRCTPLKLHKNPMRVSAQTIKSVTDKLVRVVVEGYIPPEGSVEWADTLIRKNICKVLGRNIHIPRRTTAVVLTDYEHVNALRRATCPHSVPVEGFYDAVLDVAVCLKYEPEDYAKERAVVLHELVHRYTHDEAECRYVTCILAYLSDDPKTFLVARQHFLANPEGQEFWPSYLTEPGW